jgi:hypothetical protein
MKKLLLLFLSLFFSTLLFSEEPAPAVRARSLKIAIPAFVYSNDPLSTAVVAYPAFLEEFKR